MSRDEIAEVLAFVLVLTIGVSVGVGVGHVGTDVSIRNEAYYAGAGKYTFGNSGKREWVWTGSEDRKR